MSAFRSLLLLILLLSWALPAQAMRCGRNLVSLGDSAIEVQRLCGEPLDIARREEQIRYGVQDPLTGTFLEKTRIETIAEWTYNFGPKRFMRVVRFGNGHVVDIRTLDYGF